MVRAFFMDKIMKRINLNGDFGWEITSEKVIKELEAANGDDIEVYLASPGGSVFQGIKIYNDFRDYKRMYPNTQNILYVKGLAASMASYFMMNPVFDLVIVEDNASFMMHNPYGGMHGDYRDANSFFKLMEGLTDMMAEAYVKKIKKPKSEIRKMLDEEFWAFGEDIVKQGFADEVLKTDNEKNPDSALAMAQLQIKELNKKLSTEEIKDEYITEIAAMLLVEERNPANITRVNNIQEDSIMTLKEFLEQNPAAQKEYNDSLEAKYNAGKSDGKAETEKEIQDRIEKAKPFIGNSEYPKQISDIAVGVVKGEKTVDILDTVIATADMVKELKNSNNASLEHPPDTPPINNGAPGLQLSEVYKTKGLIMNAADMAEETKRMRANLGMEVN